LPVKVVKIEKQPDLIFPKIIFSAVPPGNAGKEKLGAGSPRSSGLYYLTGDVMSRVPHGIVS
jgi:hypothetical protein